MPGFTGQFVDSGTKEVTIKCAEQHCAIVNNIYCSFKSISNGVDFMFSVLMTTKQPEKINRRKIDRKKNVYYLI